MPGVWGKTRGFPTSPPAGGFRRAQPFEEQGYMVFEQFIRYAGLAVGLKPSATECEARLRGL